MAEIIIAKHRNGAVGDVLLRFKSEYARFQNPDDDMIVPVEGEVLRGSGLNDPGLPPPLPTNALQDNPFDVPPPSGVPF